MSLSILQNVIDCKINIVFRTNKFFFLIFYLIIIKKENVLMILPISKEYFSRVENYVLLPMVLITPKM